MNGIKTLLKKIPWWGYIMGIVMFLSQYGVYRLAELLSRILGTASYAFCPKIGVIDDSIPLVPIFVVIYIFSYVFWTTGPIAVSITNKRNIINYIAFYYLALFVGMLVLIFVPTYMDRAEEGIIAATENGGLFDRMLHSIYMADGGGRAYNLFPSFHSLVSATCYLGIRKQNEISKGFKIYTIIMVLLIMLSTVFTKQHYIMDIPGGTLIAIISYLIVNKIDIGKRIIERKTNTN